jgi:hypothetical protein
LKLESFRRGAIYPQGISRNLPEVHPNERRQANLCSYKRIFHRPTVKSVTKTPDEKELDYFVVELSLDGMPEFHDTFRVTKDLVQKSMETYDALAEIQNASSSAHPCHIHGDRPEHGRNRCLTTFLYDRCPQMDHHNLATRGDRKDPTLKGPSLKQYGELYGYIRRLWAPREEGRYGGIVEPMLQWNKLKTIQEETQVVPCRAGILGAVVYANGDVSLCESHQPLGNLREKPFWEIWDSEKAHELRKHVACKECWCTTEVFMWQSIVYQPMHLLRVMLGSKAWESEAFRARGKVDLNGAGFQPRRATCFRSRSQTKDLSGNL